MTRTIRLSIPAGRYMARRFGVAVAILAACSPESSFGPPIERGNELIHTDATEYVATLQGGSGAYKRYGTRIVATFTNRTAMPLWLERCLTTSPQPMYDIVFDRQQSGADDSTIPMYSHVHACVGHDQHFRVEPGAQRTDTLDVSGPNIWQNDKPIGHAEGRMRVSYRASVCQSKVNCLPVAIDARSHPFDVRIAR